MINHYRYPDPTHLHFNKDGEMLDGRLINSVQTIPTIPSEDILLPELATIDETLHRIINATSSTEHRSKIPTDILARRWGTSLATAERTIQQTTQRGLRYLQGTLSRRFRTRQKQLDARYLRTKMYTDKMFKEKPSARGNTCIQLFVTSEGFVAGQPMKSKAEAYDALDRLIRSHVRCSSSSVTSLVIASW